MKTLRKLSKRIADSQGVLPFSDSRQGILAYAYPWERRLVGSLTIAFAVLVILYIYFVTSSIVNVATRQDLLGKIVVARTSVSSLETRYFEKTQAITESYARSVGFVAFSDPEFVNRDKALTLH